MKIEVGKFYKTRDGRKSPAIESVSRDGVGFFTELHDGQISVYASGRISANESDTCVGDLISEWTDEPKEVGTLAEIGAQVGDVVSCSDENDYKVMSQHPKGHTSTPVAYNEDEGYFDLHESGAFTFRIISRAKPTGPVRTVTRKDIVQGVYGSVCIEKSVNNEILVCVTNTRATNLDGVIATLTSIRDALVENEG